MNNKKRKLWGLKVGGVKMKKNEKKHILQFEKTYYLYSSFLDGPLTFHFQDDL